MKIPPHLPHLAIPQSSPALIRLEKVRKGVIARKSFRQLARELKCNDRTVREDFKKLCLPPEKFTRIASGADALPIMREHDRAMAAEQRRSESAAAYRRRQHDLKKEQQSGLVTKRLKNSIVHFLAQFDFHPNVVHGMVLSVEKSCWLARAYPVHEGVETHAQAIEATKPATLPADYFDLIEAIGGWLCRWLIRVEPNREIRDRGIVAARQFYEPHMRV